MFRSCEISSVFLRSSLQRRGVSVLSWPSVAALCPRLATPRPQSSGHAHAHAPRSAGEEALRGPPVHCRRAQGPSTPEAPVSLF